jgi:hypothetical protein
MVDIELKTLNNQIRWVIYPKDFRWHSKGMFRRKAKDETSLRVWSKSK